MCFFFLYTTPTSVNYILCEMILFHFAYSKRTTVMEFLLNVYFIHRYLLIWLFLFLCQFPFSTILFYGFLIFVSLVYFVLLDLLTPNLLTNEVNLKLWQAFRKMVWILIRVSLRSWFSYNEENLWGNFCPKYVAEACVSNL